MKDLKLELFNFRKNLSVEQDDISKILEGHINACSDFSEKTIIQSLNQKLKSFTFDRNVRSLLESLNNDLSEYNLVYELKHLYNVINSKNQGELYRQPINVLLQTINLSTDQDRMSKILNELAVYDWVPEIKLFVYNLTKSPIQKENLLSGGSSESVYSLVHPVEEGYVCHIKDSWFLLTDDNIEKVLLENYVKDSEELRNIRTLETGMKFSTIKGDRIDFRISENLTIGLSANKKGVIYINDDEMNKETTLESLFTSPIIPIVNKNFYPILLETSNNLDKFVELDIVRKVTNLVNPFLELYAFNYKNSNYLYRCDERYGNSFYSYESALELVNETKSDLNYDLTFFFENKLDKEVVVKRKLEDKEREITLKLEDVTFNIEKLQHSIKYIGGSNILNEALDNLKKRENYLNSELQTVKELQYKERLRK